MGDDKRPPRPGSMSDDDRALTGRRSRTPAAVPEVAGDEDSLPIIVGSTDDTPPMGSRSTGRRRRRQSVQEFAEETKLEIRELRAQLAKLPETLANDRLELTERIISLESRLDSMDHLGESTDELRQLRIDLTEIETRLFGVDGKNGKLGTLEHKATSGKRWAIAAGLSVMASLGGAVTVVWKLSSDAADRAATIRTQLENSQRDRSQMHDQLNLLFRITGQRTRSVVEPIQPGAP